MHVFSLIIENVCRKSLERVSVFLDPFVLLHWSPQSFRKAFQATQPGAAPAGALAWPSGLAWGAGHGEAAVPEDGAAVGRGRGALQCLRGLMIVERGFKGALPSGFHGGRGGRQ